MNAIRHGTFAADLTIFADYFALASILPVISFFITEDLNQDKQWIGVVLSGQYVGVILGTYLFGLLGDHFSKRNLLSFIMAGECICCLLSAFKVSITYLLVVRFMAGAFSPQISLAWVNELSSQNEAAKAIGRWSSFGIIGFLAGSAISAVLSVFGWFYVNLATCVLALLSLAVILAHDVDDPISTRHDDTKSEHAHDSSIFTSYSFLIIAVTNLTSGFKTSFTTSIPAIILMDTFKMTPAAVAIMYFIAASGYLVVHGLIMPCLVDLNQFKSVNIFSTSSFIDSIVNSLFLIPQVFDSDSGGVFPKWFLYGGLSTITAWLTPLELGSANMMGGNYSRLHPSKSGSILGSARTFYAIGLALAPFVTIYALTNYGAQHAFLLMSILLMISTAVVVGLNFLISNE